MGDYLGWMQLQQGRGVVGGSDSQESLDVRSFGLFSRMVLAFPAGPLSEEQFSAILLFVPLTAPPAQDALR